MPFDLANTILSQEDAPAKSSQSNNAASRTSLAQKMNHLVTADNDLQRKSLAQAAS